MLENLSQYENLGTPSYFCELFQKLRDRQVVWTTEDVRKYFHNRIVDGKSVFDGCLPLALALGLLSVDGDNVLSLDSSLTVGTIDEARIKSLILERLLRSFKEDEIFINILRSDNVSYDVIYQLVQIDRSAFTFKHAGFRQLLLALGFLQNHPDHHVSKYIVNARYRRLFDTQLLPEIRRRKIGIERLRAILERRQINGLQAEEFVLEFEKRRLHGHPQIARVERISDYDVSAGYDVVSFDEVTSGELNRFIEVKSFIGGERFHWSNNEVAVSRLRRATYYLYLVDRKLMTQDGYVPTMVRNPYENIFQNERLWYREAMSWRFSRGIT